MPQVVNRKMRHAGSSQGSPPSALHAADRTFRFAWTRKDKPRIRVRFFFPFAQNTERQVCKRKRFGRARCFHVTPKADQAMFPIYLVPTQPESLAIGSASGLDE